jgi:tRNA-splicing ligase RtcB
MQELNLKLSNGKSVYSWCPIFEEDTFQQIEKITHLPFVEHMAIMPDAHYGVSCPIGGVIGCKNVVVPNFVGVDIGCGMATFKTNLKKTDIIKKQEIHEKIDTSIPMGFSHNTDQRMEKLKLKYYDIMEHIWTVTFQNHTDLPIVVPFEALFQQLGTLGGGNHFIEMQYDEEDYIWIMVHSGSRNIGKKVCDFFNKIALTKHSTEIPYLEIDSLEGQQYLRWMNLCLEFAYYNRKVMLEDIKTELLSFFPNMEIININNSQILNIHHNYAVLENHFGKNLMVHRKGATLAAIDTMGIIPGSMGSTSYIVQGRGNPYSLHSCSHGAGRNSGRNEFNKLYNTEEKLQEIRESLKDVVYSNFETAVSKKGKSLAMLDVSEAPQAYKDITEVIKNELDLITPKIKLKPLLNWKA